MTPEAARKQLQIARDMLKSKEGRAQYEKTVRQLRSDLPCDALLNAVSVLMVFAADAELAGKDHEFYSKPANEIDRVRIDQGCDDV